MATPEAKATELKNQGNKAFAAHDWPTAVDFYTKAIELNDKEPTFWSNRAQVRTRPRPPFPAHRFGRVTDQALPSIQAYIKTEAYGFAIRDATKAIELNPSFVKVRIATLLATRIAGQD